MVYSKLAAKVAYEGKLPWRSDGGMVNMVQYLLGMVIGGIIGYFFCAWMIIGKIGPPNRADR